MLHNGQYKAVAIVAHMRSGSNLLERLMGRHPAFRIFGELFNPHFIGQFDRTTLGEWSLFRRDNQPSAFLDHIIRNETRMPVFRIFDNHNDSALFHVLDSPEIYKILIKRSPLESYISLKIAEKTDQWRLGRRKARVSAHIYFDREDYKDYAEYLTDFHYDIKNALFADQQVFATLQYGDLLNVEAINEALYPLGVEKMVRLISPLRKQNPAEPRALVTNPDDLPRHTPTAFSESKERPIIETGYVDEVRKRALIPMKGVSDDAHVHAMPEIRIKDIPEGYRVYTHICPPALRSWRLFEDMIAGRATHWQTDTFAYFAGRGHDVYQDIRPPLDLQAIANENDGIKRIKQMFYIFLREMRESLWANAPEKLPDTYMPQAVVIDDIRKYLGQDRPLELIRHLPKPAMIDPERIFGPRHQREIGNLYADDIKRFDFEPLDTS